MKTIARKSRIQLRKIFGFSLSLLLIGCDPVKQQKGNWIYPNEPLETVGVHAALLSNGKVLVFSYWDKDKLDHKQGRYQLWDPETRKPVGPSRVIESWNPFCSGHSFLGDGRLFVAGGHVHWPGHSGGDQVGTIEQVDTIEASSANSVHWNQSFKKMENLRWYPSVVTLSNGDAQIIGGSGPLFSDNWKDTNKDFEYFSHYFDELVAKNETNREYPEDGNFDYAEGDQRQQIADGKRLVGLYPLTHLLPTLENSEAKNGLLFVLTESFARIYDPYANLIKSEKVDLGGFRTWWTQGSSVILPISIDENGNEPEQIKIMVIGGGTLGTNEKRAPALNDNVIVTYDVRTESIVNIENFVMNRPRFMGDSILLPDGNILVVGGAEIGFSNTNSQRVTTPELITLNSSNDVSSVADMDSSRALRGYHASSLLLPDASILVTGGNGNWDTDLFDSGPTTEPFYTGPTEEFFSVELFDPPYKEYIRPQIDTAPNVINIGDSIQVQSTGFNLEKRIVLVRHGSRTHSLDTDQRLLNLEASIEVDDTGNSVLTAKLPDNATYMPPGPYMLFVLSKQFNENNENLQKTLVPSDAKLVMVTNKKRRPKVRVDEVKFVLRTGGDNLSSENDATVKLFGSSGTELVSKNISSPNEKFENFTTNSVNVDLPSRPYLDSIKYFEISHTAKNCGICSPDNWNVDSVIVSFRAGNNWFSAYNNSSSPLIRFTDSNKHWKAPLQ